MKLSIKPNLGNADRSIRAAIGMVCLGLALFRSSILPKPSSIILGALGVALLLEAASGY
ncbi:MAG: YgaP-like transmembrane domain [Ignavibacteriales bacterium]